MVWCSLPQTLECPAKAAPCLPVCLDNEKGFQSQYTVQKNSRRSGSWQAERAGRPCRTGEQGMGQACAAPENGRQWQGHGWVSQDEGPLGPKSCVRRGCHLSRRSPFLTEAAFFMTVLASSPCRTTQGFCRHGPLAVLSREARVKGNGAGGCKPDANRGTGERPPWTKAGDKDQRAQKSPPIKTTGGL